MDPRPRRGGRPRVRVTPALPRLHAITDERVARRADLDAVAGALQSAGAGTIAFHARGRGLSGREHHDLARRLPRPLIVNDRLDIALATDASGVQLGHGSLSVAAARALRAAWWIGRSVHDLTEARTAVAERADYLVAGPVFATATHPGRPALGLDAFARIATLGVPTIAIGGVTRDVAAEIRDAGAYGLAAIRALWDASDPGLAARELLEVWA
jgi:thiamine-phosphate pyrophosphorylase